MFKRISIKFGEFTNFWMLFQMTSPIFNSIDTEYSHQEKICSYPVPCSFKTWPITDQLLYYQQFSRRYLNDTLHHPSANTCIVTRSMKALGHICLSTLLGGRGLIDQRAALTKHSFTRRESIVPKIFGMNKRSPQ